jgi:2-succinyl-5-enolpyruvyl-6-hydroxy-3-cyclohexene-1-carboxylate synthase
MPIDTAKYSVSLNVIKDKEDLWDCQIKVNTAILELKRSGGGPVHIHLTTNYSGGYEVKSLQQYRQIQRFTQNDSLPELPEGKIAIFIGSGCKVDLNLSNTIDRFCQVRNAVVFCDHTSSYQGKFKLLFSLVCGQESYDYSEYIPDLLIYIGEISGDYYSHEMGKKQVWRVSIDGELRDTFKTLTRVFEMPESVFFSNYSKSSSETKNSYFNKCFEKLEEFRNRIPELPFSNLWIASQTASRIPDNSVIHFAILNSLRSWNFFPLPNTVRGFANVGGFGIDGCVSTLIGSSLSGNKKLHFGVFGDLAFFYDMNSLGNRHVGANLRILIVNNGCGVEFRNYNHRAAAFGDSADNFIAATGHYGNKSKDLIKHFVQDLGFIYISAENKTEYCNALGVFLNPNASEQSICLEVFTNANDESDALKAIRGIEKNLSGSYKQAIKRVIGEKTIRNIKGFIEKA